ncbi:hypothetical protein Cme02nite_33620 [Catellatospora methionotrophica]|uniref:Sulfotransferase family protein n=1 Tax=Catellatospora methionotrophica TaxID=121620 RepID=A0A8J3LLU6_9ACTN|nr:sulfotransferase family protein [Catellatospora methionotrophica]GIG15030.1 hypothetical protein Cme02nite_33620 [Catellatospora methionotrophica]
MTDPYPLLHQLATAGDPALNSTPLPPDGRYQVVTSTVDDVTAQIVRTLRDGFAGRAPADFPLLVLGWGRCRVGSTAVTNLFGMAGAAAFYQPVKTIGRFVLTGGEGSPWKLPDGEPVLFAKEMAGPYVPFEALFNPARCLIEAGWPVERLRLLILDRQPRASLDSWMAKWEAKIGRKRVVENFTLSTLNYALMRDYAAAQGLAVTHFPYESSRAPEQTVSRLFDRLGIAGLYRPQMLTGWGAAGDLNSDQSKIHHPVEPEPYVVPGLHGNADEYRFRDRQVSVLTDEELAVADSAEVVASYQESVRSCARELDLPAPLREEIFG